MMLHRTAPLAVAALALIATGCSPDANSGEVLDAPTSDAAAHEEAPHFDYSDGDHGPEHWGDVPAWERCATGTQQSPIDVPTDETIDLSKELDVRWSSGTLSALNNSHTVNVRPDGNNVVVRGDDTFQLVQMHLHADSEHDLDGKAYPLEAHFVHGRVGEDGEIAMTQDADTGEQVLEEYLVLGVMLAEGERSTRAWRTVLSPDALPSEVSDDYMRVPGVRVNPTGLLPSNRAAHTYTGSLTTPTPTCVEGVNWYVLTTPVTVGREQIDAFTALYSDNSRPVQPR